MAAGTSRAGSSISTALRAPGAGLRSSPPAAGAGSGRIGELPDRAQAAVSALANPPESRAVPDVGGNRRVRQQVGGGSAASSRDQARSQEHADIQSRDRERPRGEKEIAAPD